MKLLYDILFKSACAQIPEKCSNALYISKHVNTLIRSTDLNLKNLAYYRVINKLHHNNILPAIASCTFVRISSANANGSSHCIKT